MVRPDLMDNFIYGFRLTMIMKVFLQRRFEVSIGKLRDIQTFQKLAYLPVNKG